MRNIFKILILLFISFTSASYAKGNNELESKDLFNFDIFSLTKKKENAFDAPSSVYVLASEDIRRSGVSSIPEALRLIPGVQVARVSGNQWAVSIRGFNHQYSSKLLIMIDGRVIYTPLFSGALWDNQDYVLEDIEKIEVIRGPGGSIWGANAMNGIINIITKSAAETQGVHVSQTFGNNDNSITEVRQGGKLLGNLNSYRLYAKHVNRDGFTKLNDGEGNNDLSVNNNGSRGNNDGLVSSRAGFKYDINSIDDNSISVHGDVFKSTSKNYLNSTTIANLNNVDKEAEGVNLVVNWNKTISNKSSFTLQAYYDYSQNDIVDVAELNENAIDIDFQHFYSISRDNQLSWGFGYRKLFDDIKASTISSPTGNFSPLSYFPSNREIDIYSAFLQDKFGLIEDELFLTIGSKFEINEQTGFEYQPNARLTYYPSRDQTVWVAVSRAIRTPTRAEDGIDIKIDPATSVTRGDQSSQAETVLTYELGYRIKPTNTTLIDTAIYFSKYSRLGAFDSDENGTPTASNNGRAETFGGELTGKWQVTNDWRLEAGYDFLKMNISLNAASNEHLPINDLNTDKLSYFEDMSPRNQFRLRSFFNVTPKVEFDNIIYYVDSLASKTNFEKGVPSYIRLDTRVGYLFSKNLDLSFGIQNILDDRHQEFNAGLFNNKIEVGRTFYGKAVLQF